MPWLGIFTVYLTEVATLCNLFMFFSSTKANGYSYVELWPWLLLASVTFFALRWFLKEPRPLAHVIGLSAGCGLVTLGVMSLWHIHVITMMGWGFAWLFITITIIRAPFLLLGNCTTQGVVLGCELPVVGIAFLLWMDACDVYALPPYYAVCTVVILLLNIASLSVVRMYSVGGTQLNLNGVVTTVVVCFGALGGLAVAFVHFAGAGAAATVRNTSLAITWIYTTILSAIVAFVTWLASLIPTSDAGAIEMEAMETMTLEMEAEELAEIDPRILMVLSVLVLVLVLYGLLVLFLKVRAWKVKVGRQVVAYHRPTQVVERISLWRRLRDFFKRLYKRCAFQVAVFIKRNTPQGAVIVLSRIGKTRGIARDVGESYGHYLRRLSALCHSVDANASALLETLAEQLNVALYSPQGVVAMPLRQRDYQCMRRGVKKVARQRKKDRKAK